MVFPNQQSWGTHVNVAGGAVARHAPNRAAAVKFLEYLASDSAQAYFANDNNEFAVVSSVKVANPALDALGPFKADLVPAGIIGANSIRVQQMLDRVGFK